MFGRHHGEDSKRLISSQLSGKYTGKASFNHRAVINLDSVNLFHDKGVFSIFLDGLFQKAASAVSGAMESPTVPEGQDKRKAPAEAPAKGMSIDAILGQLASMKDNAL